MFGPKILAEYDSSYSGPVQVKRFLGDVYVTTGNLTQSGGVVADVWSPVLKKVGRKHLSWLILGLGAGTVAKIISDKFSPATIVGVEIDPVMLEIGKKYFGLDKIPNLEIINTDAHSYIINPKSHFDVILVDLYLGDQLPSFVYSNIFLGQLGQLGQLVIINHLFYDGRKRDQARELVQKLEKIFSQVTLVRQLTNILLICS